MSISDSNARSTRRLVSCFSKPPSDNIVFVSPDSRIRRSNASSNFLFFSFFLIILIKGGAVFQYLVNTNFTFLNNLSSYDKSANTNIIIKSLERFGVKVIFNFHFK